MTRPVPPAPDALVVEGATIPAEVVAVIDRRLREAAFHASQLEAVARLALRQAGLDEAKAMRLADRLIQRYRKAGHLDMRRVGRTPVFTWKP